jgi:Uma2 family endonuclease
MATIPQSLPQPTPTCPEPAWEIALLFPSQGDWSETDYFALDTNLLVELVDGNLEVLPMPTFPHQFIVIFLLELLQSFVRTRRSGKVLVAPLPTRIRPNTVREPDVMYFSTARLKRMRGKKYPTGADLVMEVVSEGAEAHKRDYKDKRKDYAQLGIPEYWIIDPQAERITVLVLKGKQYRVHGEFAPGQQATSVLLKEFSVDVANVFAAGQNPS